MGRLLDQSVLVFRLADRLFGLKIDSVVQVIPMLHLTPVPRFKDTVEGLANIRGQMLPVLSARRCLGAAPEDYHLNTPIILTQTGERKMGLIVDDVVDVIAVDDGQMVSPEALLPVGDPLPVLLGAVTLEGAPVFVIDPGCLLDEEQAAALNRAVESVLNPEPPRKNDKPRRSRRKLNAAVADQVAVLGEDLPPFDGQMEAEQV